VTTVEDEDQWHRGPAGRIVVGVDGSASSKAALAWALRQAALIGATVEVVAAWGFPLYVGDADFWPVDVDLEDIVTHQLQRVLDEVVPPDCSVPLRAVVVPGPPVVALLDRAVGAELLVLGSRGHGEFAEMVLGSVSLHCVARAPCPVVVVREEQA
jgi:nucleotide-binding universal stress UspA family protein